MQYIESLREGNRVVSQIYLCKSKNIQLTKAGKEYGNLIFQDKTGTIEAKIWDLTSPGIEDFETMDYVSVEADVTSFNNNLQLNVKRIRLARSGEYETSDYLPVSKYNTDDMYKELENIIQSVKNTYLNAVLKKIFIEDKDFADKFKYSSAAKSVHHSFVGGLLEHSLSVTRLCIHYCSKYKLLNYDLLITAALLHDIGKTVELSAFPENDYTDEGQLLGHIIIGLDIISKAIATIDKFPPTLANELKHCIVAHHGELEYGSPKKPALIEAMALNLADNTDAKLQTFTEIIEASNGVGKEWLGYNRFFESNIRKTHM